MINPGEDFEPGDSKEVGGTWHIVATDFPTSLFGGLPDARAHVVNAVIKLEPEDNSAEFMKRLETKNGEDQPRKFVAAILIDTGKSAFLEGITIESRTITLAGRGIHLGNCVIHCENIHLFNSVEEVFAAWKLH